MKIRKGFVSNSSSSSFVIGKNFMSEESIAAFRDVIKRSESEGYDDETFISEGKYYFHGEVSQHDEFIIDFLNSVDVMKYVEFGD